MGSIMDENLKKQQEFMLNTQKMQLERQMQMQLQMRQRMLATQLALTRERLYWWGGFYTIIALGGVAGAIKIKKPIALGLVPLIPLTFVVGYQADMAWGNKMDRVIEYGEGMVSVYSCCRECRDSAGCQVTKMHVTAGARPSQDSGYWQTSPPPPSEDHCPAVLALDCEMCYTTRGLLLTRVSVVDMELNPVFESLVKPSHPIVDYNTRFSGLTSENFVGVETTLEQVQQQLLWMVHSDTILLGHSLESDLIALKLVHSRVVDTAVVFPHRKGPPYKRALKSLMGELLQRIIQDNIESDGGHDSLEDSRACMELMLWKVKADLQKTTRRVSTEKQPGSS